MRTYSSYAAFARRDCSSSSGDPRITCSRANGRADGAGMDDERAAGADARSRAAPWAVGSTQTLTTRLRPGHPGSFACVTMMLSWGESDEISSIGGRVALTLM